MNDAHWHLVVNHFPIIGTIFGLGVMIAGFALKNNAVKNTAYGLFIVSAIFAFVSVQTGGGAAGMVKDMPDIGKKIIHEHAEMGEKLALILYALALLSGLGMYFNSKNNSKAKLVSYAVLVVALVAVFIGKETGTSGGEIRHTEIRTDSGNTSPASADDNDSNEKED